MPQHANLGEYEGLLDVDERLVSDLLAQQAVADDLKRPNNRPLIFADEHLVRVKLRQQR
jgi:hypothetical protein